LLKIKPFLLPTCGVIVLFGVALLSKQFFLGLSLIRLQDADKKALELQLEKMQTDLNTLRNQDQFKRNEDLQNQIKQINLTYTSSISVYQKLVDLRLLEKTDQFDTQYAQIIKYLSDKNYSSASATLTLLDKNLQTDLDKLAAKNAPAAGLPANSANITKSNTPPGTGFSRQVVHTDIGDFTVDIIAADMGSTRVIVDTASDSDCHDNCPVLSLGDYVSRSGAFAGVNGSYFCPASYPTCAGKANSYDTLLMNKNKHYFNSDNNVYSTVPAVIFGNGFMRVVGRSLEWGRDTGIDSMIANQPLTLSGGNIAFSGDGDPKKGSKGARSFVGNKGSTAYIGVVYNATVAEVGYALKSLGLENALNLDSGGSTALWSGGYKAGPGRNIPNAILFVRK
jgi:hypothetical protein